MEIELSDVSGLPDGLRPIVAARDGKNFLDLSKLMVAEDLSGLKTALQKERENVGAWAKFGKPDDVTKRFADLEAAAAKGGKSGDDAQAKLDAMKADYEGKLTARDARFANVLRRQANAELRAELAKAGFIPEAFDDVARSGMDRIAFGENGEIRVTTADGKPMIGSGADHGATLGDLAKELAGVKGYALRDGGVGGGGKPPGTTGGTPAKTATRAQFDAMDQHQRTSFFKDGGKLAE